MSQKHARSQVRLLIWSVLILLFSCAFFLPEIVSTYWHLRFGDSITYHSWRVPVPRRWYAITRDDHLIIQKTTRFYDNEDAPTIIPDVLSPSKTVDPEAFRKASIRVISKEGYVFQEERSIQIGADRGFCLHFTTSNNQKKIHITCDSLAAQLSVGFFGPSSEIQTFYSVVGQIRRQDIR
jgi:hypothetical protein